MSLTHKDFLKFKKQVDKLRSILPGQNRLVLLVLFRYFRQPKFEIDIERYSEDIDFGLEYGYFDSKFEPSFIWYYHPANIDYPMEVGKWTKPLHKIYGMMACYKDEDFIDGFKKNYDAPLDMNDKEFWEKLFNIKIEFP